MKFSGYITGQFEGGNLSTQYNWGSISNCDDDGRTTTVTTTTGGTVTSPGTSTRRIAGTVPSVLAGDPEYI